MCGIAGIIGKEIENKDQLIRKMVECIHHRGPDADGFFDGEKASIGMRRLSIIDLATGDQPIFNEDESMALVFNGEIYNYKELREQLLKDGHKLKTKSDTEVVLLLYEQYGEKSLLKLRGMFAFCIYDKKKDQLFIARDYFGIKPMYFFMDENRCVGFGSEIKSLLLYPKYQAKIGQQINEDAIFNYLSYQYNPLKETFFKNIFKLLPGNFMRINLNDGTVIEEKYWGYEFHQQNIGEEELKKEILAGVEDTVRAHMVSDVPVGAFLSGGIDSAAIVAMMSKIRKETGENLKTFTIGFDEVSEQNEAKVMADLLGTDHTEINISPEDYFKEMPKIVWHFDEPVADPSAVALYFLAREARKHVKVVLSGEGSDELFGGYNIYREPFALAKIDWLPRSILKFFGDLPFNYFGRNYFRRASKKLEDRYIGNANIFQKEEIEKLWQGSLNDKYDLSALYNDVAGQSDSAKMQYIDLHTWLPGDILAKADKMTMANSLELRVPFLDIEIAKISEKIPDTLKYKNGQTKYIFREATRGILPKETAGRKKLGFPTPIKHWLRTENGKEIVKTIIENQYIKSHFNIEYIQKIVADHQSSLVDNARKIYILYMLALWYNVFINHETKI